MGHFVVGHFVMGRFVCESQCEATIAPAPASTAPAPMAPARTFHIQQDLKQFSIYPIKIKRKEFFKGLNFCAFLSITFLPYIWVGAGAPATQN
jgi:hypothetical protein